MAETKIDLQVITPERKVVDQHVRSVVIPAHDGELGILAGRAPLMCELGVGTLRYSDGARTQRVAVSGGFAQVHDNHVTVLTERAYTPEDVTPEVIKEIEQTLTGLEGTTFETQEVRRRTQETLSHVKRLGGHA